MAGKSLSEIIPTSDPENLAPFNVKESVFPFIKFSSADILLGPEMKSTGEVMGRGKTFEEAFRVCQLAAGVQLKKSGSAFISLSASTKPHAVSLAKMLLACKYRIYATRGTHQFLQSSDIPCQFINKVSEGAPHILELLETGGIDLIINTTEGKQSIADSFAIRRLALQLHIPITTTIPGAYATCAALTTLGAIEPQKL